MVVGSCVYMRRLNIRCAGLNPITPVAVFLCSNKMSFGFLFADAAFLRSLLASFTADSALPLDWLGYGVVRWCSNSQALANSLNYKLPNFGPPSVMNNSGIPYLAKWLLNLSMTSRDVADESSSISKKSEK